MPILSLGTDRIVNGTHGVVVSTPGTHVFLMPGVNYAVSGGIGETGIYIDAAACEVTVMGAVTGVFGVRSTEDDLYLSVTEGGVVGGWVYAVQIGSGGGIIDNAGTITGARGIASDGRTTLVNTGHIQATSAAVGLSESGDTVINTGRITGIVQLNGGDDSLDTSGGRVIGQIGLGGGNDSFSGGDWRDHVFDGAGSDTVDLGAGNDILVAGADGVPDEYDGGAGTDLLDLRAATGIVVVDLTRGYLRGGGLGTDLIAGFERVQGPAQYAARLVGDGGANAFICGNQADTVYAAAGNDVIRAGLGSNFVDAGSGNDRLFGGDHGDRLIGGDGDDVIHGAYDTDLMSGGAGNDRFVFRDVDELFANTVAGDDRITDFVQGQDIIDLSQIDWNATGPDSVFTFRGAAGLNGPGQVAFRHAGGNTFVDIAWQAAGAADSIRLDGIITLTANDFWL